MQIVQTPECVVIAINTNFSLEEDVARVQAIIQKMDCHPQRKLIDYAPENRMSATRIWKHADMQINCRQRKHSEDGGLNNMAVTIGDNKIYGMIDAKLFINRIGAFYVRIAREIQCRPKGFWIRTKQQDSHALE